ncbi:uncharacterized protein FIBRA_00979 [Fibroporia radiculosa]|uniref:Elongator complex protein 4 n=1 Tax=Fibroporia radiculosa TaxID=599839 RepID=J4I885_9APHY|nr:uncharacterized protein FIBRA_00979 [Fibroporia radiculosa]CCL98971.1 predicted protein [Fibroporia radiculosa]
MSSFKRKTTAKQAPVPNGTRFSPGSTSTLITSTGIPSLDDILGGGLPLSCSLLILAPDHHSAYGELLQKYFVAQGLACGQKLCIVDNDANQFLAECMWMPGPSAMGDTSSIGDDEGEGKADEHDAKIKIAWRYEQMKQFKTTVPTSNQLSEDYCRTFDLTCRIPDSTVQSAITAGQVMVVPVSESDVEKSSAQEVLLRLSSRLAEYAAASDVPEPIRVCIPALGSSQWGDLSTYDICRFLFALRDILRRYPGACAAVSLQPYLCTDSWGGPGWVQKLSWLSDACVSLAAFTGNPSLTEMFSSHNGLVHIHSLPAPHTLLPPSDKFSTLRGLSSSGENNLAFKCMRKRLIFETLHLDLEGGVGERRTTPASNAVALDDHIHRTYTDLSPNVVGTLATGGAAVQVELESGQVADSMVGTGSAMKKVKVKKKVAFASDLYEF